METAKRGWAVVTGASSGLGAEFARQLAAKGYDLALVARRRERLEALAAEIGTGRAVATLVVERDLGAPEGAESLIAELDRRGVEPTLLVNNAGIGPHGHAVEIDEERAAATIRLNVLALTLLTMAYARRMARRGSGAIVNVASTAAFQPVVWFAVYGATKAYVLSFSEALAFELAPRGVRVLALCPGPTRTEFHDTNRAHFQVSNLLWMSADRVVAEALSGLERGRPVVVPGVINRIGSRLATLAPRALVLRVAGRLMRPAAR